MKTCLVLGAGGFIGSHLVNKLKKEGNYVVGVDLKYPEFSKTRADYFIIGDLISTLACDDIFERALDPYDEIYQLAAVMGGAGFIFTGKNDANIVHDNALINLNIASYATSYQVKKIFFSSSACVYNQENQLDPDNPKCSEESAYPANPDSPYGFEKLFSEKVYDAYHRNYGLDIRIARFHNIFGPEGAWNNGLEKAPAAICRKVAEAKNGESIEIWGDGLQTRSFLYIDECLNGVERLMNSDYVYPVNIGSEEMISINNLAQMAIDISGKNLSIKNIPSDALGVRGRNSDNRLIKHVLGWEPNFPLREGMKKLYKWIDKQVKNAD
jgi:nucleoside-diphosphate-sugar epimerase